MIFRVLRQEILLELRDSESIWKLSKIAADSSWLLAANGGVNPVEACIWLTIMRSCLFSPTFLHSLLATNTSFLLAMGRNGGKLHGNIRIRCLGAVRVDHKVPHHVLSWPPGSSCK